MEVFVGVVFCFFKPIIPLLLIFLFFCHLLCSLSLRYFFSSERPSDEAEYVLGNELLHMEWQILLNEIISGTNDTEIIISCKSDRLELFHDIFLGLVKFLLINFQTLKLVDLLLIFTVLIIIFLSKLLHFVNHSVEIVNLCLT